MLLLGYNQLLCVFSKNINTCTLYIYIYMFLGGYSCANIPRLISQYYSLCYMVIREK